MNTSGFLIFVGRVTVLYVLLSWTPVEAAETRTSEFRCPTSNATIEAHSVHPDMPPREICRLTRRALDHLASYGLALDHFLRIEIVEQLQHSCGIPLAGQFDTKTFRIQITSFNQCIKSMANHPVLSSIPAKEWYGSIIGHEIVHAAIAEKHNFHRVRPIAQEYLAYAIQLSLLNESDRKTILDTFPRHVPKSLSTFNFMYLLMNPLAFAANAYRHLFSRPNINDYIRRVLASDVEFPRTEHY